MTLIHHDSHLEVKSLSMTGMFSGYGSVYDNADMGDDIVAKGAFTESLVNWSAKGRLPALLWQHKASEPIGAYTHMQEDDRGLHVQGQLAMKTQGGAEAYDLLKLKAISGLSIGFMTKADSYDKKTGVRTINKADLWEVSLVTFPMNDAARVDTVKNAIPKFENLSDFERYLRDVYSATKSDARAIVSEARTMLRRDAGSVDISQSILRALNKRSAMLTKGDSEVDEPPGPDPDDNCNLAAGCCMPDECCNAMGCCMAKAVGAMGPM